MGLCAIEGLRFRLIIYDTNRFPYIVGVAKEFQNHTGWTYGTGI